MLNDVHFCFIWNKTDAAELRKYINKQFASFSHPIKRFGVSFFQARSLVVSDLRSETKDSRLESGC